MFDGRRQIGRESMPHNLVTALEMISNRQSIPGEKTALMDAGSHGVTLECGEPHYLLEHWREIDAEQQHENNAVAAAGSVFNDETEALVIEGADAFLAALAALWDVLDSALLPSGRPVDELISA